MKRLIYAKGVYDNEAQAYNANGLLIENEKIETIGEFEQLRIAHPQAEILDYRNEYLFPGLINTHVHLEFAPGEGTRLRYLGENEYTNFLRAACNANTLLRSGVTTARDAGSSWRLLQLQTPASGELVPLPRLQLAGPPITITGGHLHFLGEEADSYDELIKAVRQRHKQGCGAIKIIVSGGQMTPGSLPEIESYSVELIKAMTEEAKVFGMPTFSHCLTTQGFLNSMYGGIECIEHGACFVRNKENGLLERIYEPEAMEQFRGRTTYFTNAISNNYHAFDHCRDHPSLRTPKEAFLLKQEQRECEIFQKYLDLGLRPVVGTDAGCSLTYFDETWLECEIFVTRCGMTPADAIAAATTTAADCLGLGDTIGRLKPGYAADMISLPNDPLNSISALRKVSHVIHNGKSIL